MISLSPQHQGSALVALPRARHRTVSSSALDLTFNALASFQPSYLSSQTQNNPAGKAQSRRPSAG